MNLTTKQYDKDTYEKFEEGLRSRGFEYIGQGAFRAAWKRKNAIIKIPKNEIGYGCNILEAYAYRKYRKHPGYNEEVYAPCRLLPNACLMMPVVEMVDYACLPKWCNYIDGAQCGRYHDRIVVYDAGGDIIGEDRQEALRWARYIGTADYCTCLIPRSSCPNCNSETI